MPIECSVEIAKLTTNVLKELDNVVMGARVRFSKLFGAIG